jgi:sulfur-carrier protein
MKLKFYAVTKDIFGESLTLDNQISSIEELMKVLVEIKPESENILKSCRFAIDLNFVDSFFLLQPNHEINIIPPSSGG